jgi:hypothetical protein
MEHPEKQDKEKKQLLLRIAPTLWADLNAWAEEDFRSLNGQIEYLLTDCVRRRKKGGPDKAEPTNGFSK